MRILVTIFFLLGVVSQAEAAVRINEIAWMGNAESSTNEWVELSNTDSAPADISGWVLRIEGKKDIILTGSVSGEGYYLVERTDDETVPGVSADLVGSFGTGLSNEGAILTLLNTSGAEVDRVNGTDAWKIGGGDVVGNNTTKETAQRGNTAWITAPPTPRAPNSSSVQTPVALQSNTPVSESSKSTAVSVENFPVEPQIFANAGARMRTTVVGAPLVFAGKVVGLKKEPIDNARMVWSFGDGAMGEGVEVSHVYYYPGQYTAVLDASSGHFSASDRVSVLVSVPKLLAETGGTEERSFVRVINSGSEELDLSYWNIVAEGGMFIIPKNTFLRQGAELIFASEITHLKTPDGSSVALTFPNGVRVPLGSGTGKETLSQGLTLPLKTIQPRDEVPISAQKASVIEATSGIGEAVSHEEVDRPSRDSDSWPWYTGAALIGVLGILALRLGKRGGDPEKGELNADDFEIIEEDNK